MMDKNLHRIVGDDRIARHVDSDYLASGHLELDKEYTLTIDKLYQGKISTGGKAEQQIVITFKEREVNGVECRPMILNATNRRTLKKLFGSDRASALEGKQIIIYVETGVKDPRTGGGTTEGLRIRSRRPNPKPTTSQGGWVCKDCGKPVSGVEGYSAEQIAATTSKRYGAVLCFECSVARKNAQIVQVEAPVEQPAQGDTPLGSKGGES